jgi:hypothetical protein
MVGLERAAAGISTDLAAPLAQVAATVRKRGLLVLISDLLSPTDVLETHLHYLRSQGHEIVLLRVLDPAELDLSFDKASTFVDLESGRNLYVDPALIRQQYRKNFAKHAAEIDRICAELGISMHQLLTNQPLELALFDFLQSRLHGTRQVHRSGNRLGGGVAGAGRPTS